jgi:hypothetical protein
LPSFEAIEFDSDITAAVRTSQSEKQLREEPVHAARAPEAESTHPLSASEATEDAVAVGKEAAGGAGSLLS